MNVNFNIGTAHNFLGNMKKAKEIFLQVESIMNEMGIDVLNKIAVQVDLARITYRENNFDEALKRFRDIYKAL